MGSASTKKTGRVVALIAAILLLTGCETRSISNSGYSRPGVWGPSSASNPFYRGELTEFDVLGIDFEKPASDEEIARSAAIYRKVSTHKGASILVIQSGALIPDDPMVRALGKYFSVIPFSGVPLNGHDTATARRTPPGDAQTYSRALRLAAAKAGADLIFCYWGMLESAIDREPTKAVSWVPIVGSVIPDEAQNMRIRLKVAVIDVKTGSWSMFSPEAFVDRSLSASLNRAGSDQEQVEQLKQQAYQAAVDAFVTRYVN